MRYRGRAVVVTAGTFLRGLIHVGLRQEAAGRAGEFAAVRLSDCLRDLGLTLGRLKTGTSPRLRASTIDYDRLEAQWGDPEPWPFHWAHSGLPASAGRLSHHPHDRGHPCGDRRQPRPLTALLRRDRSGGRALLSLHRGQDSPLPRSRSPSGDPRARRPRHRRGLCQRHLDQPSRRRAGSPRALHPRARARRDHAARLCDRVRLRAADADDADARDAGGPRALSGRAGQRHHRLRGGGGARILGRRQCGVRGARAAALPARPLGGLHGGDGRRPRDPGHRRAVPDVHVAGGVPAAAPGGQCRSADGGSRLPARPGERGALRGRRGAPAAGRGRGPQTAAPCARRRPPR